MDSCYLSTDQPGNNYSCRIISSYIYIDDVGYVKHYGLCLYNTDASKASSPGESCTIHNITAEYEEIIQLKQLIDK